jgi:hypothetical protein
MRNYPRHRVLLLLALLPGIALLSGCVLSDTLQTFVEDFILELVQAAAL